jgi:beta-1,4-mannosyltransferase
MSSKSNVKVVVYPISTNPYQNLLYSQFKSFKDVQIEYINEPKSIIAAAFHLPLLVLKLVILKAKGFRIIHIHWLYGLRFPGKNIISYAIADIQIRSFFMICKILKYKVCWTVHDLLPHERHSLNDLKTSQLFSRVADFKIVPSNAIKEDMHALNMNFGTIKTIPLGSFGNIYPQELSKAMARKIMNIKKSTFVLLSFGRVEPYKGILELLESLYSVYVKEEHITKDIVLIIAGKCIDKKLKREIENKAYNLNKLRDIPIVRLEMKFIDDNDVQIYHRCADVEVYPFREITNSSSVLLSFGFGNPIIAPKIGAIKDLPKSSGIFYDHNDQNGLTDSLVVAIHCTKEQLSSMSIAAIKFSESLSWIKIADNTRKFYHLVDSK